MEGSSFAGAPTHAWLTLTSGVGVLVAHPTRIPRYKRMKYLIAVCAICVTDDSPFVKETSILVYHFFIIKQDDLLFLGNVDIMHYMDELAQKIEALQHKLRDLADRL
jgi:hypothetical protein